MPWRSQGKTDEEGNVVMSEELEKQCPPHGLTAIYYLIPKTLEENVVQNPEHFKM